ncbi:hypothetical protein [Hafnia phage Pocis76]|uniref:Uncharacterized protein n=1 Tax=Hafnia phage Pocis76 TaxID=2831174 RepID=A0A8E7KXS3_9CAUD|nr:hypothetical protein [Hafnia phage Pocis76]
MKYRNTLNNIEYYIENGVVMMGKDGVYMESAMMSVALFNDMVRDGDLVPVISEKESFEAKVNYYKSAINPDTNIRFIAYCCATNDKKTGTELMVDYIGWISDRKRDYADKHPEMLHPLLGSGVIVDQDHFTKFIVSGEWM